VIVTNLEAPTPILPHADALGTKPEDPRPVVLITVGGNTQDSSKPCPCGSRVRLDQKNNPGRHDAPYTKTAQMYRGNLRRGCRTQANELG